jgi:activator of 2-hydroxyglutaryl-CoA dehydratase
VADAISRFIVERVADMCTTMNLSKEIVVAGGLAKSQVIIKHLASLIKQDLNELNLPEYVGAIGAAIGEEAPRSRTGPLPKKKPLDILAFSRDGGGK